jgi:hypothetical protein
LPHHWQEKQSGQGCFFLPVLHSGTYIIPRLPDNFLKRICKQIYPATLATLRCYHIFCHGLPIADIPSPEAGIYALNKYLSPWGTFPCIFTGLLF